MPQYLGSADNLALFSEGSQGIVVDTALNLVVEAGSLDLVLSNRDAMWRDNGFEASAELSALISAAAVVEEDALTAAASRMFTIPGGAQAEAKKALAWHKEHHRGGTPVGLNTARTLAKGGQIGIEKVRHIAKYFPRHEVDKKGKGWAPGEDNFPSNGRIAWALWGGDAAQRWASTIVKRENALTADAFEPAEVDYYATEPALNAFKIAHELDENFGPEFLARVRLDGSGFDRLYKVDIDGTVSVWDDCSWDTLGNVDSDIWTYDRALDDPYDTVGKDHVIIDAGSAFIIAGLLEKAPHMPVFIDDIDTEEARLVALGLLEEDMSFVDSAISAAATPTAAPASKENNQDGVDTPEERAARSENQPRNALGRFATAGQKVAVGGDVSRGAGTITKVDAKTGLVDVKLNSGATISVDSKYTQPLEGMPQPAATPATGTPERKPVDTSGIFAKPRVDNNMSKASLPASTSVSTSEDLKSGLDGFAAYVAEQRSASAAATGKTGTAAVLVEGKIKVSTPTDSRNAPGSNKETKATPVDSRNAPGSNKETKPTPVDSRNAPGSNKETKPATVAKSGDYTIQKGDNLWSIAEKNKPAGTSTADYWKQILEANPKGNFKSGDHNLIYSGEKVILPGKTKSTPADSRNAPGSNKSTPSKTDLRNAPGSNKETPKKTYSGPMIDPKTGKSMITDSRNAPGSNKTTPAKANGAPKTAPFVKKTGTDATDVVGVPAGKKTYSGPMVNPKTGKSTIPAAKGESRNAPGSNKETKPTTPKPGIAIEGKKLPYVGPKYTGIKTKKTGK